MGDRRGPGPAGFALDGAILLAAEDGRSGSIGRGTPLCPCCRTVQSGVTQTAARPGACTPGRLSFVGTGYRSAGGSLAIPCGSRYNNSPPGDRR
jgi:hypothetical protein